MNWKALCAVVVLLVGFCPSGHLYPAREIYAWLSDEGKVHFLRFYLAKGIMDIRNSSETNYPRIIFPDDLQIPMEYVEQFQSLPIEPNNFPVLYLMKFKKSYNVTTSEALGWAFGEQICYPNGECVDPGDVGGICCT